MRGWGWDVVAIQCQPIFGCFLHLKPAAWYIFRLIYPDMSQVMSIAVYFTRSPERQEI